MFDVFYSGPKPGLFAFEQPADSLDDAAKKSRTTYYWYIYGGNDYSGFDFDYVPVPWQSHYTHVWADQHQPDGNVYLTCNPNADLLYHAETPVHRLPVKEYWHIPADVDPTSIDWRWSPDPKEPPYIYAFSNQWNTALHEVTATYTVPGATQYKYIEDQQVRVLPVMDRWEVLDEITDFDYSWRPSPLDPPYIYVFGNQWLTPEMRPALKYTVPGATEIKYMPHPRASRASCPELFTTHVDCDFDYSWEPDPGSPPYIYVFGNQWYPAERMPTVEYAVAGATERKYIDYPRATLPATTEHWVVKEDAPFDFDFSWVPDPGDEPYIYVFGNQYWAGERSATVEYHVPGATERKFIHDVKATFETLDIFYIDRGNDTAQTRYELLASKYTIIKVRYANSMMDTIRRCVNRAKTNRFWVISSEYSYNNFNFDWQPDPWQQGMTHVFPSQHQKWSDTFLINRWEFERHSRWATTLEQFPNLNFVTDQIVNKPDNLFNIYYVDHGNETSRHQYEYLRVENPDIVLTRFVDNYLDTFKRIMTTATTEYVWIINSVCDYSTFDFTWQPEPWQREMIHVFPSDNQERGDTFYIHVESFKKQMVELDLLDWFNVINYCEDQRVYRFDTPIHYYETDDLVSEIKNYTFKTPYTVFTNQKNMQLLVAPCLWTRKDRVIQRLSRSGATCVVPRDIKADLKTQIYDYPYISDRKPVINDYFGNRNVGGLDIVYISNGEPDEERWYDHLCYQSNHTAKWVRGVNGRTAAYQEAARQSTTPWFFAVFAKLEVLGNEFPWYEWTPDYFQEPKHYIFNSRNPVNGLEYGHQGMIAYNKRLVLENNAPGIDFTLSQPHESVPILSGIAHYNQSEWMTWRTAFREVIKLQHFMAVQPTVETEHRLRVWSDENYLKHVEFAEWSTRGALDAVKYYNEVGGDYEKLKLSFEWAWLKERYERK